MAREAITLHALPQVTCVFTEHLLEFRALPVGSGNKEALQLSKRRLLLEFSLAPDKAIVDELPVYRV